MNDYPPVPGTYSPLTVDIDGPYVTRQTFEGRIKAMNQPGLWTSISTWFSRPFNSQGSALNWVLFLGLIIIGAFMWNLVLLHLQDEI